MNFKQQSQRARATTFNNRWKNERTSNSSIIRSGSRSGLKRITSNDAFRSFASKAYADKHGYAIRKNKLSGETEMFVRGTTFKRGGVEWVQNVLESPFSTVVGSLGSTVSGDVSRHIRSKHAQFLSNIAKKNKVDVIYGHSRGAALVNDMRVPGAVKLGLDGATILNRRSDITNYRQKQGFDALIGANARSTIKEDRWTPFVKRRYHRVYG